MRAHAVARLATVLLLATQAASALTSEAERDLLKELEADKAAPAGDIRGGQLAPLREKIGEGSIDWNEGAYYATVKIPYQARLGPRRLSPKFQKTIAEKVARAEADRVFVMLASEIRVDSNRRIKDITADNAKIVLYGNVRGRQQVKLDHRKGQLLATFKVPMRGVGGVTSKLYRTVVTGVAPARKPGNSDKPKHKVAIADASPAAGKNASADKTGAVVVIDARGTGLRPAVFPKIVTPDGKTVYDASVPSEADVIENGVAAYATFAGDAASLPTIDGLVIVQAVAYGDPRLSQCAEGEGGQAPPRKRRRRRMPLKATAVAGKLKADVVVSKEEAAKLKSAAATDAMKNARVIIVTDTTVGGTEGRLVPSLDDVLAMLAARGTH